MKEAYFLTGGEQVRIKEALSKGGFTFSPTYGLAKEGYAVSIFPEKERRLRYDASMVGNNLPAIERYINDNWEFFKHPSVHIGGWWVYDDEYASDYALYLDLSVVVRNQYAASWLAARHHQIAFYSLDHRQEIHLHYKDEDLLERLDEIPKVEYVEGYHLSKEKPSKILKGSRRGENGHEESSRVNLPGSVDGVYFYEMGTEPERMIRHRPWRCEMAGLYAIANWDDPAVWKKLMENIGKGDLRNEMERYLRDMGYDGYRTMDGRMFLFGDIRVRDIRRNA